MMAGTALEGVISGAEVGHPVAHDRVFGDTRQVQDELESSVVGVFRRESPDSREPHGPMARAVSSLL